MKINFWVCINREGHTRSSLPDLLRHDPKDREYLNQDLYDDVRHSCRRPDLDILFKPLKKIFQAAKQFYKTHFAYTHILGRLGDNSIPETNTKSSRALTWTVTPISKKI